MAFWIPMLTLAANELERDWFTPDNNLADSWESSIHANAGVDCHGCHIDSLKAEKKTVTWLNDQTMVVSLLTRDVYDERCQTCHATATESFLSTFHGKQYLLGKDNIPTCSYCHAGHEQPLEALVNPLHSSQIGITCAGCHSSNSDAIKASIINDLGAASRIRMHQKPNPYIFLGLELSKWIDGFYYSLLTGVVGFFGFYFIIDIPNILKTNSIKPIVNHSLGKSLTWIHLCFSISFVILAFTGFSIKYPDSYFSNFIMSIIGDPDNRSMIHRLAALVFIGSTYVFFIYAIFKRFQIKSFLPRIRDLKAIKQSLRYRLGLGSSDSVYDNGMHWITKFEFLASLIGVHIVLVTGLLMWFMEWTLANLDYAIFKYAQQIHGWEAILSVTTLLLVHGYLMVIKPLISTKNVRKVGA